MYVHINSNALLTVLYALPTLLQARFPGNLNLSFAYVEGESLLMALKEVKKKFKKNV